MLAINKAMRAANISSTSAKFNRVMQGVLSDATTGAAKAEANRQAAANVANRQAAANVALAAAAQAANKAAAQAAAVAKAQDDAIAAAKAKADAAAKAAAVAAPRQLPRPPLMPQLLMQQLRPRQTLMPQR